jgi:hypothetical protein
VMPELLERHRRMGAQSMIKPTQIMSSNNLIALHFLMFLYCNQNPTKLMSQ